jgi:hypothetical protein
VTDNAPDAPDAWDKAFAWLAKHGALPAIGVLTIAMGAIFWHTFGGEVIGDDNSFHLAESARIADCIREGDWDFWNPSANAGYASAYYYQVLPQLMSALPAALFGHHLFWFQLSIWLPLVLIPAAAYRGARLLGAEPWPAVAAALAVAFISGASRWGTGADGTYQVGLYTQTWALAAFPLGLGHGVRWLRDGASLVPAVAWGTFVFLCHPFAGISLDLALAVGAAAYALHRMLSGDPARTRMVRVGVLAVAALAWLANAVMFAIDRTPAKDKDPGGDLVIGYIGPLVLLAALIGRMLLDLRTPPAPQAEPGPSNRRMLVRLVILGACLLLASTPGWLTLVVDRDGFGGFPHRVGDEVGPGYKELTSWFTRGGLLDYARPMVLTWLVPVVWLFGRGSTLRWLWAPAAVFAALLALGPHLPKTGDDLLPAVRFLGALQIAIAFAVGLATYGFAIWLWQTEEGTLRIKIARYAVLALVAAAGATFLLYLWLSEDGSWPAGLAQRLLLQSVTDLDLLRVIGTALALLAVPLTAYYAWQPLLTQFGLRTAIAAIAAIAVVLLGISGGRALSNRVYVLGDYKYKDELYDLNRVLAKQPPGRKQVGPGAESHYWNLLSYEQSRRESLLQMGGGGLQASPNYDFLWSVRDFPKLAWVYATPYFVFERSHTDVPEGETIYQTENYELRRLVAPALVSAVQVTGTLPQGKSRAGSKVREAALTWLRSDLARKDHVLAYDGYGGPGAAPQATVLRALRQDSPGDLADILAEVDVTAPTTFIARESWHPRWHAYVDGRDVPVRRVTPDFPAIDVPAGKHVLAFRFERPWWANAAWLLWPLALVAAWLVSRRLVH